VVMPHVGVAWSGWAWLNVPCFLFVLYFATTCRKAGTLYLALIFHTSEDIALKMHSSFADGRHVHRESMIVQLLVGALHLLWELCIFTVVSMVKICRWEGLTYLTLLIVDTGWAKAVDMHSYL